MKILYISHTSNIGGAARSLMYMAKGIKEHLILLPQNGTITEEYNKNGLKYEFCRIPALFYSQYQSLGIISILSFIRHFFNIFKLAKYIKQGYNIFHFNEVVFAPVIFLLKLYYRNDIKIVIHVRVFMPKYRLGITRKIFTYMLKKSDYIIGIGEKELELFQEYKNKEILYNSVDMGDYIAMYKKTNYLHKKYNIGNDKKIAGYFGAIHKGKGQDFIVNVLKNKKMDNLIVIFFGDGEMKEELENTIKNSGIKNIVFAGFINNVFECMEGCDFILRAEDFGLYGRDILEANLLGVPMLASKSEDNKEEKLIQNGINGYYFKPFDEKQFTEKLELLMTEHNSMRGNSLKMNIGIISSDEYSKKITKIYETLR